MILYLFQFIYDAILLKFLLYSIGFYCDLLMLCSITIFATLLWLCYYSVVILSLWYCDSFIIMLCCCRWCPAVTAQFVLLFCCGRSVCICWCCDYFVLILLSVVDALVLVINGVAHSVLTVSITVVTFIQQWLHCCIRTLIDQLTEADLTHVDSMMLKKPIKLLWCGRNRSKYNDVEDQNSISHNRLKMIWVDSLLWMMIHADSVTRVALC